MRTGNTLSFDVDQPPATKAMPTALSKSHVVAHRVHVVFGANKDTRAAKRRRSRTATPPAPITDKVALVVTEVNGDVVAAKKILTR